MPVMYCALFDYATGDDYGKSYMVHSVIKSGGNLAQILFAGFASAREAYLTNEGTWASNFLLAMQPGVWGERFYALTPFIGIFFLGIGTGFILYELLIRILAYPIRFFWVLWPLFLTLTIQCMPYIRGGLFWHPGMAHYDIPFAMALLYIAGTMQYYRTGKRRYLPFLLLSSIYLGGSHYQAMLLCWLSLLFLLGFVLIRGDRKRKELFFSLVFVLLQLIGFYFCYKAPGNNARAEAEFSFTASRLADAVIQSVIQSTIDGAGYLIETRWPVIFLFLVFLFGVSLHKHTRIRHRWMYAILIVYFYLVYCAMYTPGLYYGTYGASLDLSGGYYDVNYYVFLLFVTLLSLLIGNATGNLITNRDDLDPPIRKCVNAGMIIIAVSCVLLFRHLIGRTTDYICVDFITSGQLADFQDQMQERLRILEDDSVKDAVVPQMNDQQGPFMHMALSEDPECFTNWAAALYFQKDSIVAIPRNEFYDL